MDALVNRSIKFLSVRFPSKMPTAAFPPQVTKHYELKQTIGSGEYFGY